MNATTKKTGSDFDREPMDRRKWAGLLLYVLIGGGGSFGLLLWSAPATKAAPASAVASR